MAVILRNFYADAYAYTDADLSEKGMLITLIRLQDDGVKKINFRLINGQLKWVGLGGCYF